MFQTTNQINMINVFKPFLQHQVTQRVTPLASLRGTMKGDGHNFVTAMILGDGILQHL